ncbi:hypothetical protein A2617_03370 [Candidatus Daviesbacteria bacterium RIFOXYD1_FULL_41_10]|uniref:Uncharacterized protein n=1 Tax=Candidatus Daviesbacteria bacterium RIFOXYD1_FULL_41_10 TaxID=1797801 RepID=A0A1F5MYY6_9BACT|nr:MAG: hypothetical protein A2617_03370 [Candidatus Daviesbacteria bacterium RIFOXYD1_FULL_41_10]
MAYKYTNNKGTEYFLHSKDVRLRSGRQQRIYFFAREERDGSLDDIPEGFMVVENPRTGLPILKKK